MMTINESNVTMVVKDLDESIKFFKSIGLTLKNRWKNDYAMVESTGITIGLHPTNKKKLGSGSVSIGFMLDLLAETMAVLEKNHITCRFEDGKSGKYIHFDDLDGTDLYFVDPKWE